MKIVLNMIVKNEAAVIERCLDSARPAIDAVVIADTGSTDNTKQLIHSWGSKNGVQTAVFDVPWENFSQARNRALAHAAELFDAGDYAMVLDADEVWDGDTVGYTLGDHDVYTTTVKNGGLVYQRNAFARLGAPLGWKGAVHEYLDGAKSVGRIGGGIRVSHDGARSKNPLKYATDAALLLVEHANNPSDPRTAFYLAQSLRDAGMVGLARAAYEKRAGMGGWAEEQWFAQYQAALLANDRAGLMQAWKDRPTRAEPLIALADRSDAHEAMMYLRRVADLSVSKDALFVDSSCYWCEDGWRFYDLVLRKAYYTGDHGLAQTLIMLRWNLPRHIAEQIENNKKWYVEPDDTDIRI